MTRIKISLMILAILLAGAVFSGVWVNLRCGALIEDSDSVRELWNGGRSAEAVDAAEKLERDWEDFRRTATVLVKNNKLAEVDRVCTRISYFARTDSDELVPELIELRNMLEQLKDGETPKLTTVL
jgi:hypothetical protein